MSNKIFNLTEAASIGIHSMVFIAKNGDMTNVARISDEFKFSKHHVAKVMQRLNKVGMVGSNRGPSGGFFLTKEPAEITLLEIYEAIEGRIPEYDCPMGYDHCPFTQCLLGSLVSEMTTQFKIYLQEHTLQFYLDHGY
jgi:Rrf2 family protein